MDSVLLRDEVALEADGLGGDPILYWNAVALEANRVSHTNGAMEQTGPPLSARALAIVHLAMYDAFAGVAGNPPDLPPYLTGLPKPAPGASAGAAVAAAAHATLSKSFPSQKPFFDFIEGAQAGLQGPGSKEGRDFGLLVAQKIGEDRENDPDASASGYKPSLERGRHRSDPDNPNQGFHAPFYGARSKLFAVTKRHELKKPPQPGTSAETADPGYKSALQEVRAKGIKPEMTGTLPPGSPRRTEEQTLTGVYWAYDGARGLGTPPRLYNQIIRELAIKKGNTAA